MEATPQEKFEAAVKVIQSIPRNGAFQPSSSLLLRFYGYYKQATTGPCNIPRPAFYDVMGRTKWDAWKKLGDMSKEEAMNGYVEELKNIIEAMPHTDKVSAFISKLGDFYELVDEKVGEDYKKIKPALHVNGDISKGEQMNEFAKADSEYDANHVSVETSLDDVHNVLSTESGIVVSDDDDDETDEFCDTFDTPPNSDIISPSSFPGNHSMPSITMVTNVQNEVASPIATAQSGKLSDQTKHSQQLTASEGHSDSTVRLEPSEIQTTDITDSNPTRPDDGTKLPSPQNHSSPRTNSKPDVKAHHSSQRASDVSKQLMMTVNQLQEDVKIVMSRLEALERSHHTEQKQAGQHSMQQVQRQRQPWWWWPFGNLSVRTVSFFILWPFVVHWLLYRRRIRYVRQ